MATRKPTTIKANKLITIGSKATRQDWVRANAELTTQFIALLAKLDADLGVEDTNYAALLTPAPRIIL